MKVCMYCETTVEDSVAICPNCTSNQFKAKCPRCGQTYEGAECPQCRANEAAARHAAEEGRRKQEAWAKANTGLGWKTALTFFMPYFGGYFLAKREVRAGFRWFAIIWGLLLCLSFGASDNEPYIKFIGVLMCLGPVALYLYREKAWVWKDSDLATKVLAVVFAAVLVVSVGNALSGGSGAAASGASVPSPSAAEAVQSPSSA